jgi:dipeptidyl aminopeptidase/acylaminoacyl peptidase
MPATARARRPFASRHALLFTTLLLAAAAGAGAQELPTLAPADYAQWETPGLASLSPDGRWLIVPISRVDQDGEVQLIEVASGARRVLENAVNPAFSANSRWLAYSIAVPQAERRELEEAKKPIRQRLGIIDLRTGEERVTPDIAGFEFSGDGAHISLRGYSVTERKSKGVDVIVRNLASGHDTNLGNVAESAWQDRGALLALVIDAENRIGNGVQLFDAASGVLRTLDSDTAVYSGLAWRRRGDDLAVRRDRRDSARDNETHLVLAWTGLAGRAPRAHRFDQSRRADFPADARVVSYRPLSWAEDGRTLFFGTQEWPLSQEQEKLADDERPGVEIWHARDVDIIPEQKVRAEMNRRRSSLAAWHLPNDRFVEIWADPAQNVVLARDQNVAIVYDALPHERDRMFGPALSDLHAVDVTTGESARFAQGVQWAYGASPTGRYALYVHDSDFWVYDVRRGSGVNVTRGLPTSFVNLDNDHTIENKPPFGYAGWTAGDRSVLLYDKYDIWEVRPDGSAPRRLTNGAEERVRYRVVRLDFDDPVVDLAGPVYLFSYGETTKQYGYARLTRAGAERLVWMDRNVTRLVKAENADVYAYMVQSFHESPNYYVGGPRLADARRVTDTNPFQSSFAWSPRSELIDFTNARGQALQAALHYPANYQPGRQYPMIVYYYEITSNQIHNYSVPSERSGYNPTVWTQEGYFVLRPDITYRDRNPGVSAVESIIPALDAVLARGDVDPARVGATGHSWGGYQTTFLATATDRFAAAVAGAPLTELYSMYLSIYWNTGGTDARIFEISQGRMEVPPWEDLDAYLANSPVHHIRNMRTPLLMAFGDKDGAVDWQQGIVMYNAARRENKDFVLLVYPGENHGLAKKPNQIDYHRRALEWFGHYLKGEPAPAWMTDGIRYGTEDVRPPRGTAPPAVRATSDG